MVLTSVLLLLLLLLLPPIRVDIVRPSRRRERASTGAYVPKYVPRRAEVEPLCPPLPPPLEERNAASSLALTVTPLRNTAAVAALCPLSGRSPWVLCS